jgi:predicted AAA+ superfamily ATPase
MDDIDRTDRLIGIKGSRGIGKTTFLLSYAKEFYGINNRECLYINLNHFFFTQRTIVDFARDFHALGGRTLLLDQVFKYPDWSHELRICYDTLPDLQIVFSGPAVMRLKEENPDLAGKVAVYQLRGFSFREYLNLTNNTQFPAFQLKDILQHHQKISKEIAGQMNCKLMSIFKDYLHHGFYPFFMEKRNFSENLLKTMNMTLEVDVSHIRQIEQRYLPKLRRLLYMISLDSPCTPNISQLSNTLDMSRLTVMNYIKYLKDARLVNMLYRKGEEFPKKPAMVYMYNSNLLHALLQEPVSPLLEQKTFFYNQLLKDHTVNTGTKYADFTVNKEYRFCIKQEGDFKNSNPRYCYVANTETSEGTVIPLWLFGFLY